MKQIHIGTLGWSYDFWRGNFYAAGTRSKDFLVEYSKHFDTVEIEGTFYRMPSETSVKNWRNQTPEDFIFSAKFPSRITHIKRLENCGDDVDRFINVISFLGNKLGPLLIQLPPSFRQKKLDVLRDFLSVLPSKHRYVVELRNVEWFEENLFMLLRENDVSLAIVDHPNLPIIEEITANFVYVRWEGNPKLAKGTTEGVEHDRSENTYVWAERIRTMSERHEVFGYFSKYYEGNDVLSWRHASALKQHLADLASLDIRS
jgi:uncharacterized protein YecE (DUF72 family)